jgi:hypothetical protein
MAFPTTPTPIVTIVPPSRTGRSRASTARKNISPTPLDPERHLDHEHRQDEQAQRLREQHREHRDRRVAEHVDGDAAVAGAVPPDEFDELRRGVLQGVAPE